MFSLPIAKLPLRIPKESRISPSAMTGLAFSSARSETLLPVEPRNLPLSLEKAQLPLIRLAAERRISETRPSSITYYDNNTATRKERKESVDKLRTRG